MKYKIKTYKFISEEIIETDDIKDLYYNKLQVTGEFNEETGELMRVIEEIKNLQGE